MATRIDFHYIGPRDLIEKDLAFFKTPAGAEILSVTCPAPDGGAYLFYNGDLARPRIDRGFQLVRTHGPTDGMSINARFVGTVAVTHPTLDQLIHAHIFDLGERP